MSEVGAVTATPVVGGALVADEMLEGILSDSDLLRDEFDASNPVVHVFTRRPRHAGVKPLRAVHVRAHYES
ncbi:hypothetical protein BA895_07860 [Humibacillus sp. DSM 29435]|nr:hypothetical protein BA895_07860 [Humibacillus sp. DSM 29435]